MTSLDSNFERCYKRAIFHLGRRALSSFKLKEKLSTYFTEEVIDRCLQELTDRKYLDDQDYLQKRWQSGKLKGQSNYAMARKLGREGFDAETLKNELRHFKTEKTEEDLEIVLNYIKTKKRNLLNSREKLCRHLAYKGHNYSFIEKIWQKLTSEINDCADDKSVF